MFGESVPFGRQNQDFGLPADNFTPIILYCITFYPSCQEEFAKFSIFFCMAAPPGAYLPAGGRLSKKVLTFFRKPIASSGNLWYTIPARRRSSAGQSARFTSVRSWVRAPSPPPNGHCTNTYYFFKGCFAVLVWL